MQDRVFFVPGRVKLEPVAGQTNLYDLTRADQPPGGHAAQQGEFAQRRDCGFDGGLTQPQRRTEPLRRLQEK